MATALKRSVYTRSSGAGVPPSREAADPALQRFLDAVWMERGLSANTLAAYRADLTALARWLEERDSALLKATRIELLGFIAARVEGGSRPRSTARQLSSFRRFFRFMVREGLISRRPHRADRDAQDRPLAAEIAHRGGGRCAARGAAGDRSAGPPRPHHARGALCDGPAGLRAREPQAQPGQSESGRHARGRQGQSRAADSARATRPSSGCSSSCRARASRSCWSGRPTTCSRRAAAIA